MSPDIIKSDLGSNQDMAASSGTAVQENIEMYYNGEPQDMESKEFGMFSNYTPDLSDLEPFRTEGEIFDAEAMVARSVDMILQGPVQLGKPKYRKTFNKWLRGNDPLTRNLQDCNFVHYTLQFALCKNILEKKH
ncbi:unnamed protein product, partial [Hapterophycus canaliculatus]